MEGQVLKIVILNGSLKKPKTVSNTDHLAWMLRAKIAGIDKKINIKFVRLNSMRIATSIKHDEGKDDAWPKIEKLILESDIVVFASPVWWGSKSSLIQSVIERLDAINEDVLAGGDNPLYGKVAGILATGSEDGAQAIYKDLAGTLSFMGFTIPPEAGAYWVGEMGILDADPIKKMNDNDSLKEQVGIMARNLIYYAKLLKENEVSKLGSFK